MVMSSLKTKKKKQQQREKFGIVLWIVRCEFLGSHFVCHLFSRPFQESEYIKITLKTADTQV